MRNVDVLPLFGVDDEHIQELILFLHPLDLGGSREKPSYVSPSAVPALLEYLQPSDLDSNLMVDLKRAALKNDHGSHY